MRVYATCTAHARPDSAVAANIAGTSVQERIDNRTDLHAGLRKH